MTGGRGGQWRDLEACWGGLGLLLCCVCALLWPSGRLGASRSKRLDIGRRVLGQWSDVVRVEALVVEVAWRKGMQGERWGGHHLSLCGPLNSGFNPRCKRAVSMEKERETQAHFDDATRRARDKDVRRELSSSKERAGSRCTSCVVRK